jgi:hypothetical protein
LGRALDPGTSGAASGRPAETEVAPGPSGTPRQDLQVQADLPPADTVGVARQVEIRMGHQQPTVATLALDAADLVELARGIHGRLLQSHRGLRRIGVRHDLRQPADQGSVILRQPRNVLGLGAALIAFVLVAQGLSRGDDVRVESHPAYSSLSSS